MKKSTGEFKGEMFVAQWVIPVADTGLGGRITRPIEGNLYWTFRVCIPLCVGFQFPEVALPLKDSSFVHPTIHGHCVSFQAQ